METAPRGVAVSIEDADYPGPLRHIYDPPAVLYIDGGGDWRSGLGGLAIGIVGARDATAAGLAMARTLGRDLAEAGVAVVSGLALGIDTAAHAGALEAGGTTVAVVGCGTDVVYPRRNRRVRDQVLRTGLLVSEWPPRTEPRPYRFPLRNRMISGLSLGIVIVEATQRSGALITARSALEQGREVFAVPGPAGAPRSRGPHELIKAGACLVENVQDILELAENVLVENVQDILGELAFDTRGACPAREGVSGPGAELLEAISEGAQTVDAIAVQTGRKIEEIWADLLDLEVRGQVVRGPGGHFAPSAGTSSASISRTISSPTTT